MDQITFPELEKDFLQRFRSFFRKMTAEVSRITVPNGIKIENPLDTF